jgi:L-asparaginase
MVKDPTTGGNASRLTAADLLAQTSFATTAKFRLIDLVSQTDTGSHSPDLLTLARCLQNEGRHDVDGIVVTHGTDTMEEVAFFINETVQAAVPIVFTGAMRPSWAAGYDGVKNLENALRLAATVSAEYGTLVTMGDTIFEAWSVYKADTDALDAFAARRGAPYGRVYGDRLVLAWRPVTRQYMGRIPAVLPMEVPILSLGIADEAGLLEQLSIRSPRGVVIAGIAAGTVPPLARQRILRLASAGGTVVLCTGAVSGPTAEEYYYPGAYEDLLTTGVIIEDHLTPRKARIRLMISLGLQIPYAPFGKEFVLSSLLR